MALEHHFEHLIGALANSVVEAEFLIRRNQIQNVRKFFDQENQPICVDLNVQSVKPDARVGDMEQIRVPLMTLVSTNQLSIAEMQVELNVDLGQLSETQRSPLDLGFGAQGAVGDPKPQMFNLGLAWKPPSQDQESPKIAVDMERNEITDPESVNRAKVTLIVRAGEAPEGLARLLTRLNRTL